jgi:tetratricopeptide (TPR) repeat protein
MLTARTLRRPSDRDLTRWTKIIALALLIGIPLFVGFYWFDRHVDAGPSKADRAIAAAEAKVRANPKDIGARNNLAAAYVSAKRYDEGITQFGEVLKSDGANRAALLGRGIAYVTAAKLDPAKLDTTKLDAGKVDFQTFVDKNSKGEFAKTDPQLEQAYYELGVIALKEARPADAVTALESALAIDGGDADALMSFGTALIKTGDAAKGVLALQRAAMFVPTGWCDPYTGMKDGYLALGNQAGVQYATGMVALCSGQLDQAATTLQPLVTGEMGTNALLGLALVSAARGDNPTARSYYRQVLATDATNASAQIGLSQLGQTDVHPSIPAASPAGNN